MYCKTQIYPRLLVMKDFPPKNIIEEWLAKNGNPEIDKQVELEAKLLAEFEMLEGIPFNMFEEKELHRFERFKKNRQKEVLQEIMEKDEEFWEFERSSGYAGYRNKKTGEWIYEEDYFRRQKTKTVEEELLEQIKFALYCNNEAQAIRMLEQYKYYIQNKHENNY